MSNPSPPATPETHRATAIPRVSIGLPVYNGEAFLEAAIDTLLEQTFTDFELIISDNASNDRTESICRERAARDARVRYHRNPVNLGAMGNFNRVVELARGPYFKWAAHDDVHAPRYLEACVAALDGDPSAVLAFARARDIDEEGRPIRDKAYGQRLDSPRPSVRFADLVRNDYTLESVFGVMRAEVLRRTPLLGNYADCDRVLMAEIGLAGRIHEVPEYLFIHRHHRGRSVMQYGSRQVRSAWFDPSKAGKPAFPWAREFFGYLAAVRRARIGALERARCYGVMARWVLRNAGGLWEDWDFAIRHVLRPFKRRVVRALGRGGETS